MGSDELAKIQPAIDYIRDLLEHPPSGSFVPETQIDEYHRNLYTVAKTLGFDHKAYRLPDVYVEKRDITPPIIFGIARPGVGAVEPREQKRLYTKPVAPKEEFMRRVRMAVKHIDVALPSLDHPASRANEKPREQRAAPRVFIGSSIEGLSIAQYIQLGLEHDAECVLWSQGVFGLTEGSLGSLVKAKDDFDYAVLVLTPDDLVTKRKDEKNAPRDNVIFELGLFMGALGRERTFIVYDRNADIDLPTDLAGVTAATFKEHSDGNLQASLGTVCTRVRDAMAKNH